MANEDVYVEYMRARVLLSSATLAGVQTWDLHTLRSVYHLIPNGSGLPFEAWCARMNGGSPAVPQEPAPPGGDINNPTPEEMAAANEQALEGLMEDSPDLRERIEAERTESAKEAIENPKEKPQPEATPE